MSDLDQEELIATRKLNGLDDNLYKEESNIEEDVEKLKSLLYEGRLTQYGKRKLIKYYENEIVKQKQINKENEKYIVKLTDEQYRNLVDTIRKEVKKEFEQKIKDEIEKLRRMLKATMKGIIQEYTVEEIIIKRNTLEELLQESEDK